MARIGQAHLRQSILRQRGLVKERRKGLKPIDLPPPDGRKTLTMRLLERQFESSIEVLLMKGSLKEVARMLGVSEATVSVWRLRLGLRDSGRHAP